MRRAALSVMRLTVVVTFFGGLSAGCALAGDRGGYVSFGVGRSAPKPVPAAITQFSFDGATSGQTSERSIAAAPGMRVEAGRRFPVRGGAVRIGLAFAARGEMDISSSGRFSERRSFADGLERVTAAGASASDARLRSTAVMAVAYYDAQGIGARLGGVQPWVGAGLGWAENRTGAFRISYSADLQLVAPGERNAADISGTQYVAASSSSGFAWEVSAGVAHEVRPGWLVSLGVRYASLGTYRLAGQDGPARLGVDGSDLEIDFGTTERLHVREAVLAIRHEF